MNQSSDSPCPLNQNRHSVSTLRLLIYLGVPISGAGIDIFIPSLPAMARDLHLTETAAAQTIPIYLLAYGLAQPLFGTLSDSFGRRFPLLLGTSLFVLGSVMAAAAQSLPVLLLARVLQGTGVSGPAVLTKAALTDAFSGEERMRMANTMTIAWAVGPVLSPALGGYLESIFGWRASFVFLAAYSALFLLAAWKAWPETAPQTVPLRPKVVLRAYRRVLVHPEFLLLVLLLSTLYSFMTVFHVMGPFLLQSRLGLTPVEFGNLALWLGAAWFIGNVSNRFLSARFERHRIVWTGLFLNLGWIVLMVWLHHSRAPGVVNVMGPILGVFLVGGTVFPNLWGRALSIFPEAAGTAGALMGTILILGAGLASGGASVLDGSSPVELSFAYLALISLALLLMTGLKLIGHRD